MASIRILNQKKSIFILILILLLVSWSYLDSKTEISTKNLNKSINKAIDFLYENQLDYGEFKTYACSDEEMKNCYFDSSPFITTFVLYSTKDIKNEKTEIMKNKAINFLLSEQEPGGIWRYWSSKNEKHLELNPDLDDTSTISFILKLYNISFEDNIDIIKKNRNNENLFNTWINKKDNDVDCVVNANVLLYLGQNDAPVCSYINNAIISNISCSLYYPSKLSLFYMVSRASLYNITCFKYSKETIITSTLALQKQDGPFGNDLDTAFALNTLLNLNYQGSEIVYGVESLLKNQAADGSWNPYSFFIGPAPYYGSRELTTSISIEAMQKYLETISYS